jgi:hypothetical protein
VIEIEIASSVISSTYQINKINANAKLYVPTAMRVAA